MYSFHSVAILPFQGSFPHIRYFFLCFTVIILIHFSVEAISFHLLCSLLFLFYLEDYSQFWVMSWPLEFFHCNFGSSFCGLGSCVTLFILLCFRKDYLENFLCIFSIFISTVLWYLMITFHVESWSICITHVNSRNLGFNFLIVWWNAISFLVSSSLLYKNAIALCVLIF